VISGDTPIAMLVAEAFSEPAVNPEIRSADDLRGIDSDWLARDADDYVGPSSALQGGGYTPEGFVQNLDAHVAAHRCDSCIAPDRLRRNLRRSCVPGFTNTWRLVAERGLFAFDSDFRGADFPGPTPTVWLQPLTHPSPQPNCLQSWSVFSATCSMAAFSFATLTTISADLLQR